MRLDGAGMAGHSMVDGMGRTDGLQMREANGDGMVLPHPWMRGEWLSNCYAIQCKDESDDIVLLALSACAVSGGNPAQAWPMHPSGGHSFTVLHPLPSPTPPASTKPPSLTGKSASLPPATPVMPFWGRWYVFVGLLTGR